MKKKNPWSPRNGLLNDLPPDACDRLSDELQLVEIPVGKVLFEPYAPQAALYFPREGIVSATLVLENGDSSAVAMVGNEGAVGLALLTDGRSSPARYVVQAGGEALVLRSDVATAEFRRGGAFQRIMLRFMQAFQTQVAHTGVCNQHHTVEKQLTRWLLQVHDRIGSAEIRMTQEQIAHLLGVRREGITEAARRLQEDGCIRYSRGLIQVLEREGMADRACECYGVVRREYDRLLSVADA
ncbi:Crp/Fnr family transcriptional regulator [Luteimonas sp. BDR2-5]|uniref:Crp/Fnr family transcriptional regulator n=1 Tax=Proluteimonas luteida TaxID=2878685 RepID=UPI001E53BC72|nr:Crp/Fnr family transcriptional regulator [Luteimonas sp. BDR2-5]MCD9026676.1 Crp/Fnr family transcriptional regulator [Luteimonas sp. BDR2-5]